MLVLWLNVGLTVVFVLLLFLYGYFIKRINVYHPWGVINKKVVDWLHKRETKSAKGTSMKLYKFL